MVTAEYRNSSTFCRNAIFVDIVVPFVEQNILSTECNRIINNKSLTFNRFILRTRKFDFFFLRIYLNVGRILLRRT